MGSMISMMGSMISMKNTGAETFCDDVDLTVLGLGIIAGMRTFSAPAVICLTLSKDTPEADSGPLLAVAGSRWALWLSMLLASGEMAADKLSGMPDRTDPPSMAARICSGALCGAVVSRAAKRHAIGGALLGGLAAAGSTFLTFHLRGKLAGKIPGTLAAIAEDAVVIAWGRGIINRADLVR